MRRSGAAFWIFLLAVSAPARAWGPEGHRVVGDIAERYLNDRARAQVAELLKNDRLADGSPSGRRTLGEIIRGDYEKYGKLAHDIGFKPQ